MKRTLLFLLAFLPMLVSADDGDTFTEETVEGVTLTYTVISESEKTCMVGEEFDWPVPTARTAGIRRGPEEEFCQASGDITIPEKANGYRVVRIEDYAFNQAAITSVYIPNSVETIGFWAFTGCTDLKSVRLPVQLESIEPWTFYCCESLTSIDIPEGVTSIGEYAFACCKQLKEAIIPSSVEHYGESIFWNTGFTSLPNLPENLTTIPNGMFYECTQLTSIEIPQNIMRIGDTAFGRCPISEIDIPTSVTYIGVAAFANCKNLTNIVIPDNVTDIGFNAFLGCSNLKTVTLSNNIGGIREGSFKNCSGLESVVIPNGVKFIGKQAFESCSSLSSIEIPETVEEIGEQAFFNCSSLTQLFIPKSVVNFKINKDDNYWQYSYRSIIYGCNSLTSLVVDKDNPVYDSRNNCNAIIETGSNTLIGGCAATKIPEGIIAIGLHAFDGIQNLTSITLPRSLNIIEFGAFNNCTSLKDLYCYAEKVPETQNEVFRNSNIENVTLHVPAASVSAYQAVEPWKNFKEIVALSTQEDDTDDVNYLPFVEGGKQWHVVRSDNDSGCHLENYMMNEEVVKDGKTYIKISRSEDDLDVVYDTGLFREEDRKVYIFDDERQEEHLMFDYSLKEGDTYETYSYDEEKIVTYKVLSVDDYTEGPQVRREVYDEKTGNMITHSRYLQKWTVCRTDDNSIQKTWIEAVGSLEGPLENLYDVVLPGLTKDYLAYVEKYSGYLYLPFSFHDTLNKQAHGCNLPTGAENQTEHDEHHRLTYELEGNRLHVYGEVFSNCGPNQYAYFYEKPTDDPLVHRIEFEIQEIEPLYWCKALHATDFYVSGFDPNLNYIVVDNQGEEHPVINKTQQMAYRPFVEDDKVWKLGECDSGNPVPLVLYFYFDGDTIINGKTCKQMMYQRYVNPDYPRYDAISQQPSLCYEGAWYEEDKKVYEYDTIDKQFRLMYDFSLEANGIFEINYPPYVYLYQIGPRQTGGIKGFKGVYRDVLEWPEWSDGEWYKCAPWLEGVGTVYGPPTTNVFNVILADPHWFLMSCTAGDEVIYLNDVYEDGATPAEARKHRFDFTHTTKIQPKARKNSDEATLYGEYNEQQLGINLEPLDDAYLVRITDESGKTVYEKNINAGDIVGLNIDISAYPEGRYTVTVENSQETFTGEFKAQTTGIEVVKSNKSEVRNIIYNLQGQRLSTLQKGLNIVNGQKVYVK